MHEPIRLRVEKCLVLARAVTKRRASVARDPRHNRGAVLDALGLVLVLDALGELPELGRATRAELRMLGAREVLLSASASEDDLVVRSLASSALARLAGRDAHPIRGPLHATERQLVAMQVGEPSPLVAGLVAAHVLACDECAASLAVLSLARRAPPPLAAAALTHPPVRPAREGTRVPRVGRAAKLELVLFADADTTRLAIYGPASRSLRVSGRHVRTEISRAGYWLGRVGPKVRRLALRVQVGERRVALSFALPDPPPAPKRKTPKSIEPARLRGRARSHRKP